MLKLLVPLFVVMSLGACATTPDRFPENTAMVKAVLENADSADEKEDGERIYCTREPMIGTRLRQRRICKTAEEWRLISENSKEAVRDIQRMNIPECDAPPGANRCP